jgi:general secretion pathway protein F
MTTFNYKALDNHGKDKKGVIQAESPRHARQKLRELGLVVSSISAIKDGGTAKRSGIFSFRKPISSLELSLITRQFAILLNSGLSVEQSLNALIDQLDSPIQKFFLKFFLLFTVVLFMLESNLVV